MKFGPSKNIVKGCALRFDILTSSLSTLGHFNNVTRPYILLNGQGKEISLDTSPRIGKESFSFMRKRFLSACQETLGTAASTQANVPLKY